MNPYLDQDNIRTFSKDVDANSLLWHTDKENRKIKVIEGKGWEFQRDNESPMNLSEGDILIIPEGQIHRIYKGTTDLVIEIQKY